MIELKADGPVCYMTGTLNQQDVESLWSNRASMLGPEINTLELSGLSYSDSAGIAFLLALWRQHRQTGKSLKLLAPSEQVARLIALYDLQACFDEQVA